MLYLLLTIVVVATGVLGCMGLWVKPEQNSPEIGPQATSSDSRQSQPSSSMALYTELEDQCSEVCWSQAPAPSSMGIQKSGQVGQTPAKILGTWSPNYIPKAKAKSTTHLP